MQSSIGGVQHIVTSAGAVTGNVTDSACIDGFSYVAASNSAAASALLQPLIDTVWSDCDNGLSRIRHAIASWLAGCPSTALGPCHALLTSVGHFLRLQPSLSSLWLNPATPLPKLKMFLLSPESRGIFIVATLDGREVVMLDELALRRAVTTSRDVSSDRLTTFLPSSLWDSGVGSHIHHDILPMTTSGDSSIALKSAVSSVINSNILYPSGPLFRALSAGAEVGETVDSMQLGALAQPIVAAIAAAWPGANALARLKRRAALALAAAQDGPEGPYSMLASALGDVLHRHEPEAVSELRHPVTKTLRVKQLLHEGGTSEGASSGLGPPSAVSLSPSPGSFGTLGASVVGQPGGNNGNTANTLGSDGPGFLRVVKGKYDIVVVLDLPGLLQAHGVSLGVCSPLKPSITPQPATTGALAATTAGLPAAPTPPPLQPNNQHASFSSHGGASTTSSGSAAPPAILHVHGLPPLGRTVSDAAALAADLSGAVGSQGILGMGGGPHGPLQRSASSSEASSALPYGIEGAAELALRAFPGSAPGAQLRRSIVLHLAGLPRRSQLWTHLGIFVASSQAHLWLNPAHRWPKLKAFVLRPDSRGVFLDVQMPGPGAAAGLVALDPAALRRAAAAGLATAIAAAWPGHAPLERIRRAAAFTLAFAVRGPAGPYTMLGSALGTAIRKRDKEAFDALAGMGKLSELLDDTSACCTSTAAAAASEPTTGGGGTGSGGGASVGGGSNNSSGGGAAGTGSGGGAAGPHVGMSPNGSTACGDSSSVGALTGGGREGSGGGATSGGGGGDSSSGGAGGGGGAGSGGGGGSSGGAGSGGYIVSFKKDQDGYMRLRLEALLQDHPREDPPISDRSTACSSTCNSGRLIFPMDTPGSNHGGGNERDGGSGGGAGDLLSYTLPAAAFVLQGSAASLLQGGFVPGAAGLQAQQLSVTPGSSGILNQPSGIPGSQCTAAVTSSAAAAVNADVGSPPLEQELIRRFPAPPGAAPGSEAATIAAAKRCIARLLAWAPPPHQLTFAKLGAQVPKLLGGARIGRNLRLVCLEEPEVFMVQSQSPTVHVVRLVCPRLLQLAHEQSERRSQAGLAHLSSPQAQPQPPQLHPLAHLAAQQQPQPPQPQPQHLLQLGHSQHLQHQQQQQQVLQVVIGGNPATAAAAAAGGPHHHAVHSLLQLPSQAHHQHYTTGPQLHPAQSGALSQPGLTLGATSGVTSAGGVSQVSLAQAAPGRGRLFLGSHPLALQPQPQQALQQCHPGGAVAAAVAVGAATGVRVGGLGAHSNGGSHLLQQQQGLQQGLPQGFQQQQQHRLILTGGSHGTQGGAGVAGLGADAGDMQAHAAAAQQQQGLQVSNSQVGGSTAGGVDSSGRGGTGTGAAAPANGGWSTAAAAASWQLQSAQELPSHLSTSQQQQLLLLQHHHHHQQQQQQAMPQQLRTQQSLGSASVTSGGSGVVQSRLYDERLPLTPSGSLPGTVPGLSTANVDATSMAPSSVDGGGAYSARTLEPTSSQPSGSWHNCNNGIGTNGIGMDSGALSQQHPHPQSQAQLTQQPPQLAASLAGPSGGATSAGGTNGPPRLQGLQDFAASALVAEQALQQSSGAAGVGLLPPTAVHVLSDPYSPDFFAVMQHCLACAQVGLAVQVYDGRPALVALFAPSAVAVAVPSSAAGAELASVAVSRGGSLPETTWPPAVYVLDTTAAAAGEGPEAVVSTLLASLRGLLEEPGVAKVVHGCEQVRPLEVAAGASIAPLLDTRVLLDAISSMLPPLPPPPSVAAVAAAAAAGALPPGGYGSAEAAAMAQLAAHVGGLRAVLQSVELWADRPELVRVLTTLHFAAHRSELWAAAGRDSTWLSRPLTESQVAVAAQSVHHLPDLWAALCEAVPWLAAHAALRLMQHLRSVPLTLAPHGPRGRGQS